MPTYGLTKEDAEKLLQEKGIKYEFFVSPPSFKDNAGKQVLVIYRRGYYFDRFTESDDGMFMVEIDESDDALMAREIDILAWGCIEKLTEQEAKATLAKIIGEAMDATGTDGGHHKQWYLLRMIRLVLGDKYREWLGVLAEHDYQIEEGIAP